MIPRLRSIFADRSNGKWAAEEYRCRCCYFLESADNKRLMYEANGNACISPMDATFISTVANIADHLLNVVEAAEPFVPDPGTIQWTMREVNLRDALTALREAVGRL